MATQLSQQKAHSPLFNEEIHRQIQGSVIQFRQLTRKYALFHTVFLSLFVSELIILLLFLPFLSKSFLFAFVVAATFLTAFSYFVLRFYFQTKKPEQFFQIRDEFIAHCTRLRMNPLQAVYQLIHSLDEQEFQFYKLPPFLETLTPLMQKFSVWCHWGDVHLMKEILHIYSIRTQLQAIKHKPIDLELHTALASGYMSLYKLYKAPASHYAFIMREYQNPEMVQKFSKAATGAVEELKIMLHFVPNDPWALAHLGSVYHDLDQKEEERKIYETLLQLSPNEKEVRFRLGVLYFQLGSIAQGLKVYEELRKTSSPKADELIKYYDLFSK